MRESKNTTQPPARKLSTLSHQRQVSSERPSPERKLHIRLDASVRRAFSTKYKLIFSAPLLGMSLDTVDVSLANVFECGQAYVALSRARSLEGLRVRDFSAACVRADPEVLDFYQDMHEEEHGV